MPEVGKDDGGKTPEVEEIQPDKDGKYPESVPWKQYVGTKESLGGKLTAEREKVKSLDEQLKNAPNKEEFDKTAKELVDIKAQLQTKTEELTTNQEKSAAELRETLKTKGLTDEQTKDMSEAEMKRMIGVLGGIKPKSLPDLVGGGGGGGDLKGISPMELARQAYSKK